jgi:AcrR family transcriptional regulator
VLRAAFDLAVEGGLDSVTMHGIGERLGVEAMSLYRHVENKDDILGGIVDLVVAEIEQPARSSDWKAALRHRAQSARSVFARHRWAMGLIESQERPGPATLRHHEWVLDVLLSAGFSSAMATHAYNLLNSYLYGFALQEASLPFSDLEGQAKVGQAMLQQLDEYPNLVRVTAEFLESGVAYVSDFEFGLDLILDGLERVASRS